MSQRKVLQGNIIIAKAALAAGCDFFAGYPITPSSEIAQYMSKEMPKMERAFIQMEDEIASLGACIGASLSGKKTLTATSGPGFSLMQEHLGLAVMAEVPVVIVNVMRGGPSTGMPTKPSQADMMQARWGTHGDHPIIAVYPAFSDEIFSETVGPSTWPKNTGTRSSFYWMKSLPRPTWTWRSPSPAVMRYTGKRHTRSAT